MHYVPILKFKQGEWQALGGLEESLRSDVTPLLEVVPSTDSFDNWQDYVRQRIGDKLAPRWDGDIFVGVELLQLHDAVSPADAFDLIAEVAGTGTLVPVPAVSPSLDGHIEGAAGVSSELQRLCLRLYRTDMLAADVERDLDEALQTCSVERENTDVILDLGADITERDARSMIGRLPTPERWRTVALAGGEFERPQGSGIFQVRRRHLPVWRAIAADVEWELGFSDYAASEPAYTHIEGYVEIVPFLTYTLPNEWLIVRGQRVSVHGWEQTRDLASTLANHPGFCGTDFSEGDRWISERADGGPSPGNSTKLVEVRTSHHLTHVLRADLAS